MAHCLAKPSWRSRAPVFAVCILAAGCTSLGPQALQSTRLSYNEVVKVTTEEQLLLNIVRLRYTDTPSSLAVSSIAAQFERAQSAGLFPFFGAAGGDISRSFTAVLPQAQIAGADRPTISLTPLDDQEFTRKLFTPLPLDGIVYLAKTTWPISTVFRLYLENLNWVPNAQTASGPTPPLAPEYSDFRRGVEALQILQNRGQIVFAVDERSESVGGPLPAAGVTARDVLEAAKNGLEYRQDEKTGTWSLIRKTQQPVLLIDPAVIGGLEMRTLAQVFRLKPGLAKYDITQEALNPFPSTYPPEGVANLDLETRSLLQALYFVSHGVEVPPTHLARGLARQTLEPSGRVFDWSGITSGLFRTRYAPGPDRPQGAHVAIQYQGVWFYIAESDIDTKATFSLLMELSRLELAGKTGPGPVLTLPIGGR
jgi:hypothetical protein